jgi:hypothetical protein
MFAIGKNCTAALAVALAALAGVTMTAAALRAQTTSTQDTSSTRFPWLRFGLALGPGVDWQHAIDGSSAHETTFALVGGLFRGSQFGPGAKAGLIPAFKFYLRPRKTAAVDMLGPTPTILETLKLRPVMLGLGWSQPLTTTLSARISGLAGRSFNSLGAADQAGRSPHFAVPASPSAISDSFAWEMSGRLWYTMHPKVAFITGIALLHTRPNLTFADGSIRTWNADQIKADAGIAFTIFRRK